MVTIDDVKEIVEKNFPKMWPATEACMSVINVLYLKDYSDPTAINLIGMPSSEKTTILSFFKDLPMIFHTDNFSPKAFVSHAANLKEKHIKEVDLLPKIKDRCIIVPELAPIFGKRKEDLIENLSILTRIFDGEGYSSDSGVRGHRGYEGEYLFSWLGASTPFPKSVWNIMGKLGQRWFCYNIPPKNKTDEELKSTIIDKIYYKNKIKRCKSIVNNFYACFRKKYKDKISSIEWEKEKDDPKAIDFIIKCAQILKHLRATLAIWDEKTNEGTEIKYETPQVEEPERIIQIMYNIARGRALLHDRQYITMEDMSIIADITLSTMPFDRAQMFLALLQSYNSITSGQLATKLNCSDSTAYRVIHTLEVIGVSTVSESNLSGEKEAGRPLKLLTLKENFKETANLLREYSNYFQKNDSVYKDVPVEHSKLK